MYRVGFLVTGRTGLGHLRRVSHIARSLRVTTEQQPALPEIQCHLVTNATASSVKSVPGLRHLAQVTHCEKDKMAEVAKKLQLDLCVVDTARIPGVEGVPARRCLLLREVRSSSLSRFNLPQGQWDLLLIPHPQEEWEPPAGTVGANRQVNLGWVAPEPPSTTPRSQKRVVIATGGGGTLESASKVSQCVDRLIEKLRLRHSGFSVEQIVGPTQESALCPAADTYLREVSLSEIAAAATLILTTAGYNSVLEVAQTETPAVLIPIQRSHDDQLRRAKFWAHRIGSRYEAAKEAEIVEWMDQVLQGKWSREPVTLCTQGATRAAEELRGLLS